MSSVGTWKQKPTTFTPSVMAGIPAGSNVGALDCRPRAGIPDMQHMLLAITDGVISSAKYNGDIHMKLLSLIGAALLSVAAIGTAQAADAKTERNGVNVGSLICHVDSGVGVLIASNKAVQCTYKPVSGPTQKYVGNFSRLGLDVGFTTGGTIVWAVVAPGKLSNGALAGTYLGASVEATAGVGVAANVLVGGLHKSVALQPVSVQGQVGLSAAVAAAGLQLKAVN